MAEIGFHPEAQAEYDSAMEWYRIRNPRAADRFEVAVDRTLDDIRRMPEMYPWYDEELRFAVLRRFPYLLVYQVLDTNHVTVVAVAYSGRQPGYWSGRV